MTNEEWIESVIRLIAERDRRLAALNSKAETDAVMRQLQLSMANLDVQMAALVQARGLKPAA